MGWYKTGTVTVTQSSANVVGSGTSFITGASAGFGFLGPDGKIYEIAAVVSATQLTLATNYTGSTSAAQSYAIIPTQGLVANLVDSVNTLVSQFTVIADEAGSGKFADGSAAAPGIRFTSDPDTGMYRIGGNSLGFSTGGVARLSIGSSGNVTIPGSLTLTGDFYVNGEIQPVTKNAPFNIGTTGLSDGDLSNGWYRWAGVLPTGTVPSMGGANSAYGILQQMRDGAQPVQLLWHGSTASDAGFAWRRKTSGLWSDWVHMISSRGGQTIDGTLSLTSFMSATNFVAVGGSPTYAVQSAYEGNGKHWDTVGLGADGTYRIRAKNSTNTTVVAQYTFTADGKLGIGTTSPAYELQITDAAAAAVLALQSSPTSTAAVYFGDTNATSLGRVSYNNNDDSLSLWANGAERVLINASGRVGIGTDPLVNFHLAAPGNCFMRVDSTDGSGDAAIRFYSGSTYKGQIGWDAATDRLGIYSSGGSGTPVLSLFGNNVGLGISTPSAALDIHSATPMLRLQESGSGENNRVELSVDTNSAFYNVTYSSGGAPAHRFAINASEKVRINSFGYLGIGTQNPVTPLHVVSANGHAVTLNRTGSQGILAQFQKDGAETGRLGTTSGGFIGIGSSDVGIYFDAVADRLQPWNATGNGIRDAAIDIASPVNRFKDLYLSGGIYLGGTVSANLLDDYEEGNWTPTYTTSGVGFAALTMVVVNARYIKVGSLVFWSCYIRTDNVDTTGATGVVLLGGLPFTPAGYQAGTVAYMYGWANEYYPVMCYVNSGVTNVALQSEPATGITNTPISALTTGAITSKNAIMASGCYYTAA